MTVGQASVTVWHFPTGSPEGATDQNNLPAIGAHAGRGRFT